MKNIERDIEELTWAIKTFQKCVPEQYRSPINILIGKYYSKHPSDEIIMKIVSIMDKCNKKKYDTIEKQLKYVIGEL